MTKSGNLGFAIATPFWLGQGKPEREKLANSSGSYKASSKIPTPLLRDRLEFPSVLKATFALLKADSGTSIFAWILTWIRKCFDKYQSENKYLYRYR